MMRMNARVTDLASTVAPSARYRHFTLQICAMHKHGYGQ